MITCCKDCTSRHQACHDTCEKYKAEKKDFEERKAFVYKLNHSQSVYHRDYEDKHREKGRSDFSEVNLEVNEDERMERNGKEPSDKGRCEPRRIVCAFCVFL